MENASKALILGGGVLLGIMIIALSVFLITSFGNSSKEMGLKIKEDQLSQFNSQFTSYEGKNDITIYDVVTLANLATENNKYYEFTPRTYNDKKDYYVSVTLNGSHIEGKTEADNNQIIASNSSTLTNGKLPVFKCKTTISDVTRRVYIVEFTN